MPDPRARIRRLARRLTTTPALPVFVTTKAFESVITGSRPGIWLLTAVVTTGLWAASDTIHNAIEEVADDA